MKKTIYVVVSGNLTSIDPNGVLVNAWPHNCFVDIGTAGDCVLNLEAKNIDPNRTYRIIKMEIEFTNDRFLFTVLMSGLIVSLENNPMATISDTIINYYGNWDLAKDICDKKNNEKLGMYYWVVELFLVK